MPTWLLTEIANFHAKLNRQTTAAKSALQGVESAL